MAGIARIALFAATLAALFAAALAAGSALDPDVAEPEPAAGHAGDAAEIADAAAPQRGLSIADGGLRLVIGDTVFLRGRAREFSFRVVDEQGQAVTDFELEQDRRMHLIVVRRDLTGYQHLHPRMSEDGTWSVRLRLDSPGVHRAYADFARDGAPKTLAADLTVPGVVRAKPMPPAAFEAAVGSYDVELADGADEAKFRVRRDGRPIADLEPYLGARGHLVVLREGDLAYLHVHPEQGSTAPGEIPFGVEYPSAGRYRMFLQFKHGGRVRTVAFTKEVADAERD